MNRGFGTLLSTEARVWLREPVAVFFALAFPVVLLVGFGYLIPGLREPMSDAPPPWNDESAMSFYLPSVLALSIATVALTVIPVTFATFREKGVLRRLATTPMRPQAIVGVHLVINLAAVLVASLLAVAGAMLAFGVPLPENPGVVLLSFVLGVAAMYSLGLLVSARAPRGTTASGVGMLLYFPSMLVSGLWTPGPAMPDWLETLGKFTPIGASAQGMTIGWLGEVMTGEVFPAVQIIVMVVWTAVLFPLGVKLFRWT
ncbi:ABC transporter permease [Antribacter gilvus]|uniref:ABC transporter permease n=1 Tax=Antribacter gilvus TaxID=2304675 RepID=UPI000F7A0A92|nr:ABC transporter permease [Antribacter gilvus]